MIRYLRAPLRRLFSTASSMDARPPEMTTNPLAPILDAAVVENAEAAAAELESYDARIRNVTEELMKTLGRQ